MGVETVVSAPIFCFALKLCIYVLLINMQFLFVRAKNVNFYFFNMIDLVLQINDNIITV